MGNDLPLRYEYLLKWEEISAKIANAVRKLLPDAQVGVFGSIITGEFTGASDIDLIIVSKHIPKKALDRAELELKILELAGIPDEVPVEIHFATPEELERWWLRALKVRIKWLMKK